MGEIVAFPPYIGKYAAGERVPEGLLHHSEGLIVTFGEKVTISQNGSIVKIDRKGPGLFFLLNSENLGSAHWLVAAVRIELWDFGRIAGYMEPRSPMAKSRNSDIGKSEDDQSDKR